MSVWPLLAGVERTASGITDRLAADGSPVFKRAGKAVRQRSVSAFPLATLYGNGVDIQPFLNACHGFNQLRCWPYVTWAGTGWESPSHEQWRAFIQHVGAQGFDVEVTLLTDDNPARIQPAIALIAAIGDLPNVIFEAGNEPNTHKRINVGALLSAMAATGALYTSGDRGVPETDFGTYLTAHTPRDGDWPRKCHDLLEYFHGGGPATPADPPHHMPCTADEPIRPDEAGYAVLDFRAYFGGCSILGAGATFHCESFKHGRVPTAAEARCMAAALEGLTAFPDDAPMGPYRRIDEQGATSRTYVVGNYAVRIRPMTLTFPEPGWTAIDTDGVLWRRA